MHIEEIDALFEDGDVPDGLPSLKRYLDRARRAARAALVLTLAEPVAQRWSDDYELPREIAQAYFISVDGIFSHVAHHPLSLDIVNDSPLSRWEARPYFQAFLQAPKKLRHATLAYLDMTGLGLVRTWCHVVQSDGDSVPTGILCVDKQLESSELSPSGRVSESGEQLVNDGSPESTEPSTKEIAPWTDHLFDYRLIDVPIRNGQLRPQVDLEISGVLASQIRGMPSAGLKEGPIEHDGEFLVNVRSESSVVTFLHIRPAEISEGPDQLMAVAVSSLLLSFICLVVSSRRAARASESAERGTILRNLPIAFLELDEKELVLFGNDRSEEILGLELHRFGVLSARERNYYFSNLIVTDSVIEIRRSEERVGQWTDFDSITSSRQSGASSEYLCRMSGQSENWLRVAGAPVVRTQRGPKAWLDALIWGYERPVSSTFGAISEVPGELAKSLEREYRESFVSPGVRKTVSTSLRDAIRSTLGLAKDNSPIQAS